MQESYILLQSINPYKNRFRVYRVYIQEIETKKKKIHIITWGRLKKFSYKKHYQFEEEKELKTFLQALLKKRKRHQYGLVEFSEKFPDIAAVKEFERTPFITEQATLF